MSHLNPEKSTGKDKIGNLNLKKFHHTPCKPMKILFQTFLNKRYFPRKKGQVTPIFKEVNIADVACYGPISLLFCCSKVFEKQNFVEFIIFSGQVSTLVNTVFGKSDRPHYS